MSVPHPCRAHSKGGGRQATKRVLLARLYRVTLGARDAMMPHKTPAQLGMAKLLAPGESRRQPGLAAPQQPKRRLYLP